MFVRSLLSNVVVGVLTFLSCGLVAYAQTGSVKGKVVDEVRNPMPGAIVQIRNLKKGATTKKDGSYVIENIPVGKHELEVSSIGYRTEKKSIQVSVDASTSIDFKMGLQSVSTKSVEVTASRRKQEQSDTRTSVITVDPLESKYKAGAAEDVFRTLQTMPGVVAPNDFSSQLVVRGSGPDQNLILMDNIELFNPYRLYGFISMFNPETVSGISLLTGGFGAKYSDRLSAVLDIVNRDGNRDAGWIGGKLNISVTNANLVLEGALPLWNGSWIVSSRRTYYDLIAGPIAKSTGAVDGDVALPNFQDVQIKVSVFPITNSKLTLNLLSSRDNTEFHSGSSRQLVDSVSLVDNSFNDVLGFTWLWTPSKDYSMNTVVSTYKNTGTTSFGGSGGSQFITGSNDPVTQERFQNLQDSLRAAGQDVPTLFSVSGNTGYNFRKTTIRNDHSWRIDSNHTFDAGIIQDWIHTGVIINFDFDPRLRALQKNNPRFPPLPENFENGVDYIRPAMYLQDNIRVLKDLNVQAGIRTDYFAILDKTYIAPRLSASYAISPLSTLRAAWGHYYQSPGYEKLFDAQVFLDLTNNNVQALKAEKATHYVLGFEQMLTQEWQFKAEVYYKDFSDLILPKQVQGTVWKVERIPGLADSVYRTRQGWSDPIATIGDSLTSIPVNSASGQAYGLELMLQKVVNVGENKIYGWASYSLAMATRLRGGMSIPFNYDRRHNFNVVGGYKAAKWLDLSLSFVYGTGFPWTKALGVKPRVVLVKDTISGVMEPRIDTDWRGVVFDVDQGSLSNINQSRLPDYHRLDLRFTTYADWYGKDWTFYLDVINVYNHSNIVGQRYRVNREDLTLTVRDQTMLPIIPTLGFSLKF